MRVTVISALGDASLASALADLGCAVRERPAVAAPEQLVAEADLLVVEAGSDGELGRFVLSRVRSVDARLPVILAVDSSQLARVDPAWGHDDFVVLPCPPAELYARVRAAEWRSSDFLQPERIKIGPLVVDLAAHEVALGGARMALTHREFELLVFLSRARGRVRRREQILAQVWGLRGSAHTRSLDVHVRRLRSKLGAAVRIETVRGVGYKIDAA